MDDEVGRPPPSEAVNEVNNNLNGADDAVAEQQFSWGNTPGNQTIEELKECYEKIVFWRRNLFTLPKGSSGKDYIKGITRMINEWLIGSPIRECAMYVLHVRPLLLLQKPSKCSKGKDHVAALKGRLEKWKNGEFLQLLREAIALQSRLPKIGTMKNINVVSSKFREYMSKGNVNSGIKLLSNNMEGGVLPLNKETITLLEVKHPVGKAASEDTKLRSPLPTVENIIFDVIDNSMVLEAAKLLKETLDHQGWIQMAGDKSWYQETMVMQATIYTKQYHRL